MVPVYTLIAKLNPLLVECLPEIHALTSCDNTSKICSKTACLKKDLDFELVQQLRKDSEITDRDVKNTETFRLQILGEKEIETFDQYRVS